MMSLGIFFFFFSFYFLLHQNCLLLEWELSWMGLSVSSEWVVDFFSVSFGGVVSVISGSVFYYSLSYMESEKYYGRFMGLVGIFVGSMLTLIFSINIVQLILGWDGLGLSSYLLVCYYNNSNSSNAGALTVLSNRVGDVGMFFLIYLLVGSSHSMSSMGGMAWGLLLFFVGCTKSAQVPFSAWLPAAMAAPTPVSSLVHSSTLVTAGVFLMIRMSELVCSWGGVALLVGVTTMVGGGILGMVERDMKKIVALSTLSHLGVMVSILSVSGKELCFSHLVFHAFFKALLFVVVGYWIHSSLGYQDLKKISLSSLKETLVSTFGGVAILSLCGLPYLTGFYSKDIFNELSLTVGSSGGASLLMVGGGLGSILYSVRMLWLVNKEGSLPSIYSQDSEDSGESYYKSMVLLLGLAVLAGFLWSNFWVGELTLLYVMMEVKGLILSLIIGGVGFSVMATSLGLFPSFLVELLFLSSLSRVPLQYLGSWVSETTNKLDPSYLSVYYGGYIPLNSSSYMLKSKSSSYAKISGGGSSYPSVSMFNNMEVMVPQVEIIYWNIIFLLCLSGLGLSCLKVYYL